MKHTFFYTLTIFCLLFFSSSCKTKLVPIDSNEIDEVEVIKFMGTITTQSKSIDEKSFWFYKDEHATLKIMSSGFIDDIKNIKNSDGSNFEEFNYAFIVKKHKAIDTLYSDSKLKTWILKKGNKKIYFYDEQGKTVENLRNSYSFFYECW